MSDRTLSGSARDFARRARNILKKTDPKEIAEYVLTEQRELGLWTDAAIEKAQLGWILSVIMMKIKKSNDKDDEEKQLHLWDDLDQVFDLRMPDGVIQKELGNFTIPDIKQLTKQKTENLTRAGTEKRTWDRAVKYITPLLKKHADWKWRDAVKHMRGLGKLPDLPRE